MNNTTRRGFLGFLAHLPLVGTWLAKPESSTKPRIGECTVELRLSTKEFDAMIVDYQKNARLIRWIPVTERLPEFVVSDRWSERSKRVLTVDDAGVICGGQWVRQIQFVAHSKPLGWQREIISYRAVDGPLSQVTHWAELPAPPEAVDA